MSVQAQKIVNAWSQIKQKRGAAYCFPHSPPPPQVFVFKIGTNLWAFSSHITGEWFWWQFHPHIIDSLFITTTNTEMLCAAMSVKDLINVNFADVYQF